MKKSEIKILAFFLFLVSACMLKPELGSAHSEAEEGPQAQGEERMALAKKIAEPGDSALYRQECAGCHMLYLPGLLPERSWRLMMSGLEKHFGENASLDQAEQKAILNYLVAHSADQKESKRSAKIAASIPEKESPLRISQTFYFKRKHHELEPSVYQRSKIGSAANCKACHPGAEQGDFEEERVRIPR